MFKICKDIKNEELEMRQVFATVMDDLASEDERVVYLDADIINSIKMVEFSKKFPERTVNCGIQEANMIGVAAGMSATGLIPFTHTFAPFTTRRVMDQVFISCAYAKLNVRIIGSDPGLTAGGNGGTHIPLEDIGMMRMVPNMRVISPSDDSQTRWIIEEISKINGPFYVRLSRLATPIIYDEEFIKQNNIKFEIGKGIQIGEGTDASIIATGVTVSEALKAQEMLKEQGVNIRVIDIHTIKPIDKELIVKSAKETKKVITIEDHNIIGGLGGAVCEVLTEEYPVKVTRMGINDTFGESGKAEELMKYFKIDAESIVKEVLK